MGRSMKATAGTKRAVKYYERLDEVIGQKFKSRAEFCRQAGFHVTYYHVVRTKGELPSRDAAEAIDHVLEGKGYYQLLAGYLPDHWEAGKVWKVIRDAASKKS